MTERTTIVKARRKYMLQPEMIQNPLYCPKCWGRGYRIMDAEWEPYAVQCEACRDKRAAAHGECANKEGK